jgi:hypothetical protein
MHPFRRKIITKWKQGKTITGRKKKPFLIDLKVWWTHQEYLTIPTLCTESQRLYG